MLGELSKMQSHSVLPINAMSWRDGNLEGERGFLVPTKVPYDLTNFGLFQSMSVQSRWKATQLWLWRWSHWKTFLTFTMESKFGGRIMDSHSWSCVRFCYNHVPLANNVRVEIVDVLQSSFGPEKSWSVQSAAELLRFKWSSWEFHWRFCCGSEGNLHPQVHGDEMLQGFVGDPVGKLLCILQFVSYLDRVDLWSLLPVLLNTLMMALIKLSIW